MAQGIENAVSQISDEKIRIVSFNIFDTLVLRPVLKPTDMYVLMNNDLKKLAPEYEKPFAEIRIEAEKTAKNASDTDEASLDDVYAQIVKNYDISEKIAETLKKTEITLETKACYTRKSAKILYDTAVKNGKKIVLTADTCLSSQTVKAILDKNGYTGYDKLLVSNESNKNKSSGSVYHHIIEEYKADAQEILHIGSCYEDDAVKPKELGIQICYMPSPVEMIKNTIMSTSDETQYFDARCSLMGFANNYFDDPFKKNLNEDALEKCLSNDGFGEKISELFPAGSKKRKMAESFTHIFFGR